MFENNEPNPYSSKKLEFGQRTLIMGILNVTPDSFSDGNLFKSFESAVKHGVMMAAEGADIIDIGGESSRPGSQPVPEEVEASRVLPVIEELAKRIQIPISIDTYKASIAKKALEKGASIINDISALRWDPDMSPLIASKKVPVVLMHIKGTPKDMQINPHYDHLMTEIISFFNERIEYAVKSGISNHQIIIDPGIGFGKSLDHNLEIIRHLKDLKPLNKPILIGTSRKAFIGKILNLPVNERVEGTAATVAISIANGADIIRVHDVKEMARVARIADAIVRS
ncbi:dihydropteroate synthase [Candidatus Poribacteria bacterium]|nr:dihydropteroate synthase [Candidatus Poribacteria bacterium]